MPQEQDPSAARPPPLTKRRSARTRAGARPAPAAVRTSATDRLRISEVAAPGDGRIGMTLCPGKRQRGAAMGCDWERDLTSDLARVAD